MPIVFGGATLVSVAIGLIQKKELFSAHPMQYIGTLAVVLGVVLVQAYASHGPAPAGSHLRTADTTTHAPEQTPPQDEP